MKTATTIVLSDSASLTAAEQRDLALATVRATPSEARNLTNLTTTLRDARSNENWLRDRFTVSCDKTELPHYSVVGDWAKALKAVETAEVALSEAAGEINYWWSVSRGASAVG